MTSDDRFPDMADFDAELERLLSGGSPSAEAPAWFGDVAVLVRTARAPARPDELAGEEDIVARMVELRLAVLAEAAAEDSTDAPATGQDASYGDSDSDRADGSAPASGGPRVNGYVNGVSAINGHVNGVNGHLNGTAQSAAHSAAMDGRPGGNETGASLTSGSQADRVGGQVGGSQAGSSRASGNETSSGQAGGSQAGSSRAGRSETSGGQAEGRGETGGEEKVAARTPGGPTAREPMEERLRERMSLAELDEYRAKHGGERYYVAKHSAPAAEEPPHAVARTVGRVIAMKAVAITTAAALGVAAAAAATTGIVANVVVPAFNEHFQRPVATTESPDGQKDDDDGSGSGSGSSRGSRSPSVSILTCDASVLTPCVPSPLNSVVIDPVTGATLVAPSTTALDSTSTSVPSDTTTTSTTSSTTSTSEPATPTTAPPTTVAPDPQALNP